MDPAQIANIIINWLGLFVDILEEVASLGVF